MAGVLSCALALRGSPEQVHNDEQQVQDDQRSSPHSRHSFSREQQQQADHRHAKQPREFETYTMCWAPPPNQQWLAVPIQPRG